MARKKILPEDLIQGTNLQQHNYMVGAINDIDARQGVVEDITAATAADVATLKDDVDILDSKKYDKTDGIALEQEFAEFPAEVQSMIVDSFDTHLKDVLVEDDMLKFSADQKAIFLQKNRRDGITVDEQIPLSTRQNVGLATPEDLLAIDELSSRVTTLENSGITGELFYLDHDFTGITDAVRTVHFNADIGKPPAVGDSVVDSQQRSWRYVITGPATFGWVMVPHLTIGGDLKAVKSTNSDGKIYIESDSTCSVVGWNEVKNDISGNTSAIAGHVGNTSNPHSVTKAQVGLGNVDNTADVDKPISTATQSALDAKADTSALDVKQDVLTFDDAPAVGSDNVVKSGGIYDALMEIIEDMYAEGVRLDRLVRLIMPIPPANCTALLTLYRNDTSITETPPINAIWCTSLNGVFSGCSSLTTVNDIYTPHVTSMAYMFDGCSSLTSVPVMDTRNVTSMHYMFRGCASLSSVTLNMDNVTNSSYAMNMFYGCASLTSVTLTGTKRRAYGTDMFTGTPIASGDGYIYVRDNLVDAYKSASGWAAHASVIKGISEKP